MISRFEQARYAAVTGADLDAHAALVREFLYQGMSGDEALRAGNARRQSLGGMTNRTLTDDDVLTIRAIYAAGGVTQEQIGAQYGLSGRTISEIVRCATYREVA